MCSKPSLFAKLTGVSGVLGALGASLIWGVLPAYWKQLEHVNYIEILCHRVVWSVVFLCVFLIMAKRIKLTLSYMRSAKKFLTCAAAGYMIAGNWLLYIWAVNSDKMIAASLGYYISPLANVLLALFLFKERPSTLQWCAIALAIIGVLWQVVFLGYLPWISLLLAGSFVLYAAIRKAAPMESLASLFLETASVAPVALCFLLYLSLTGQNTATIGNIPTNLLLIGTGLVTSVPLLMFSHGAKKLSFATLGLLQYLGPSLTFLLGVFVYKEPLNQAQIITFILIWIALAIYTGDNIVRYKKQKRLRLQQ